MISWKLDDEVTDRNDDIPTTLSIYNKGLNL